MTSAAAGSGGPSVRHGALAPPSPPRACIVCGASLAGRRRQARCCSGACRAEAARLRGILSGSGSGAYRSVAGRLAARRKRTSRLLEPVRSTAPIEMPRRRDNAPGPDTRR
jgi:hypothetical protein